MTDHARPEIAATDAVDGVLTDHVEVAQHVTVPPSQVEAVVRVLDRLSEEISEAASILRGSDRIPIPDASSGRAWCDPWSVVDLVTYDLARRGIKSQFGAEADLSSAAQAATRLLEALGLRSVP